MEEIDKEKGRYYPLPASEFKVTGRFIPSYLPSGPLPLSENIYVSSDPDRKPRRRFVRETGAKIRNYLHNMSLRAAFFVYVASSILVSLVFSLVIITLFVLVKQLPVNPSLLQVLSIVCYAIIGLLFLSGILIAGFKFYQTRLEPPLQLLGEASEKISHEDLAFSVRYDRDDEMGRLSESFEKMREALERSYTALFRQDEERKRLNSVFSHDLRTPLTVLKGNVQLLEQYLLAENIGDPKVSGSLAAMSSHISRLENYVDIMSRLQKLEDIEIRRTALDSSVFTGRLRDTATIMCRDCNLKFYDDIKKDTLYIDQEIILTVAENLISNAIRYTSKTVTVVCSCHNNCFVLSVSDDGEGFSEEELVMATNPFYKRSKNVFDTHFGLGLNISRTLAIKHGGTLVIENISAGGALVRAEFSELQTDI